MNPLILGPLFEVGKTLIDRFLPDPEKKREAEMEALRVAALGLPVVIGVVDSGIAPESPVFAAVPASVPVASMLAPFSVVRHTPAWS